MSSESERPRLQIAVVGGAESDKRLHRAAFTVGEALARVEVGLICGGRGGVMEAACRGALSAGGAAIGILPGADALETPPNDALSWAIFTGTGQARNLSVVLSSSAVIAIGGGWGTLSEIALALKHRVPVVILESWSLSRPDGAEDPLLTSASSPRQAVRKALELADRRRLGRAAAMGPRS